MNYLSIIMLSTFTTLLAGCAASKNACEDITLATEEARQCQALQRQIDEAKGKPLIRTELERRYQKDCVDVRFYRDDKQPKICESKK